MRDLAELLEADDIREPTLFNDMPYSLAQRSYIPAQPKPKKITASGDFVVRHVRLDADYLPTVCKYIP